MTIPEAASVVVEAGCMGHGGEVFVFDMGAPVKIDELARKVIHLSGMQEIDEYGLGDIEIKYTGLRPGEKLYEELLIGDDPDGTEHPRIMKAHEEFISYAELLKEFDEIEQALKVYNYQAVIQKLNKLVVGFKHESGIVDKLYSQ